jgi:hypothetical protein
MWLEEFRTNPIEPLLNSENKAIIYFTKRDLLSLKEKPIRYVWNLSKPIKIFEKTANRWDMEISWKEGRPISCSS